MVLPELSEVAGNGWVTYNNFLGSILNGASVVTEGDESAVVSLQPSDATRIVNRYSKLKEYKWSTRKPKTI